VVYRFTNFLETLQRRGAKHSHVLFFEAGETCWSGSKLVVRQALIRHLKGMEHVSIQDSIPHVFSDSFTTLVDVQQPTYVFSKRTFKARTTPDPECDPKLFELCEALMVTSLNNNQSTILLNDVKIEGPKIFGWALLERPPCDVSKKLMTAFETTAAALMDETAAKRAASKKDVSLAPPLRFAVLKAALGAVVGSCPEGVDAAVWDTVCQVYALHAVMLDYYGPGERAGMLPDTLPDVAAIKALPALFAAVSAEMVTILGNAPTDATDVSVCDLWDGRFLHRLIIALAASDGQGLGLSDAATAALATVLKECGFSAGTVAVKFAADEVDACKAAQAASLEAAVAHSTFAQDARPMPRIPSTFLSRVIPDVMSQYGRLAITEADEAAKTVEAAKVEEVVAVAADDDEPPDDWDMSSEEEEDADAAGADDAAQAPVVAAKTLSKTVSQVSLPPAAVVDDKRFFEPSNTWEDAKVWTEEGKEVEHEKDAYNTLLVMKGDDAEGLMDPEKALNATKRFVQKLRRRLRGRLSVPECIQAFKEMIKVLRAADQKYCADDIELSFEQNEFMGLESLIVRKWQGKLKPQRADDKRNKAIHDYAQTLQGSIIQQDVIIEDDVSDVEKRGDESMLSAAENAVEKIVKSAERTSTEYANVTLPKVEKGILNRRYADAWQLIDSFIKVRCSKDMEEFKVAERLMAQINVRHGVDAKKKKKNKKGKKDKNEVKQDRAEALRTGFEAAKITIKEHNSRIVARCKHLDATVAWWQEEYVAKLKLMDGDASRDQESAEFLDTFEAERWACGRVIEELFTLHRYAIKQKANSVPFCTQLATHLCKLGFAAEGDVLMRGADGATEVDVKPLAEIESAMERTQTLSDFQMQSMGARLVRPEGTPDERVKRFHPDDWQRELMDCVEESETWRRELKTTMAKSRCNEATASKMLAEKGIKPCSTVVSAPTSSGKTFISFYVMEKVLREPSAGQGIVVYVSPTKALVNQVQADLYARFKKSFTRKSVAKTLDGVFMKEFRFDVDECQVLITVPECLDILLMDAMHNKWVHRLRWVVFDEVHCLSGDNGAIWERLLLTVKVPWIALSATIGNPEEFAAWLARVEESKGHNCKLVKVNHRINDLSINIFDTSEGFADDRKMDRVIPVNPLGVLSVPFVKFHNGIPNQTKLLPEHIWEIVHMLLPLEKTLNDPEFTDLVHQVDFTSENNARAIRMAESEEYESKIKQAIKRLVEVDEQIAADLMAKIGASVAKVFKQEEQLLKDKGLRHLEDNLYRCLLALDSAGKGIDASSEIRRMPCIVFHLSERGCNRLLVRLIQDLEQAQDAQELRVFAKIVVGQAMCLQGVLLKDGVESDMIARIRAAEEIYDNKENLNLDAIRFLEIDEMHTDVWGRLDELLEPEVAEEAKAVYHRLEQNKGKYYSVVTIKCQQENERRKKVYEDELRAAEQARSGAAAQLMPPILVDFDQLLPGYIDKRFSFVPEGTPMTHEDLREHFGNWYDREHVTTKALLRGVGLHYAELPRATKNAVERLFRQRRLKVVIATSTLALGINMPCKTVVMAGDEPHLSSQEYHQMIGRAGRRTYDNRGNVLFIGMPSRKICRLLSTNVADLVGNVPLTPTLALRLFLRYYGPGMSKDDKDVSVGMAQRVVNHPFFCMGQKGANDSVQTMHQLLFCVDFLTNPSIMALKPDEEDTDMQPGSACSMLKHLYFLEHSNFTIISLLRSGLLDDLASRQFAVDPRKLLARDLEPYDRTRLGLNTNDLDIQIDKQMEELLVVMANVLWTIPLPKSKRTPPEDACSNVVLKGLSPKMNAHIKDYNSMVLGSFSSYVRRYAAARAADLGDSDRLPGCDEPVTSASAEPCAEGTVAGALGASKLKISARSPFLANSGHGDNFANLQDLLGSLRDGIYVDQALVPIGHNPDAKYNAYLVDFFKVSKRLPLSRENGLRDHSLYDKINKFVHSLKVLKNALQRRVGETQCNFVESPINESAASIRKVRGQWRCCEVEVQEHQDVKIVRTGTLARIQETEVRGEKYLKLFQCNKAVSYPGGRCEQARRQALVDGISRLEKEYEAKFKKVFGWGKGVVGS